MKIKKAFWTSLALTPAAIVPLSTATSCSQAWGFKTPISIGSNIKGGTLDPFREFRSNNLRDLDGNAIIQQLQSNFAIDVKSNNFYGYSLPQKWNKDKEDAKHPTAEQGGETTSSGVINWDKGTFEEGSAAWCDVSSSDFVKSNTITGERTLTEGSKKDKVGETIYSYRNNTLPSVIQMVGYIGSTMSSCINYALQYQGTQIGTKYAESETGTNLLTSWGGKSLNHGTLDSEVNRQFFESIFAANAVSGTSKSTAALHPTHIEFNFDENTFPIPAYRVESNKVIAVHDATKTLLNGSAIKPSQATTPYWTNRSDETTDKIYNIRTNKTQEYKYRVYTYTNVPVIVYFNSATRAYVNPTKRDGYLVSDFYSETKAIKDSIGKSWEGSLSNFSTKGDANPSYSAYTFKPSFGQTSKSIEFSAQKYDKRLIPDEKLAQNAFIVLLNYAYKENISTDDPQYSSNVESLDRVTMTGISSIFPAYFLDKDVKLGEDNFFKAAITDTKITSTPGYIIDSSKTDKFNNLFFELLKRASGQGLVTEANKLNDTSKELLKFLAYMFGDNTLAVDTSKVITTYPLSE